MICRILASFSLRCVTSSASRNERLGIRHNWAEGVRVMTPEEERAQEEIRADNSCSN